MRPVQITAVKRQRSKTEAAALGKTWDLRLEKILIVVFTSL